jgi:hypothetical protein
MEAIHGILERVAVLALGLSAGALLAEAGVLVPMWRGMAPAAFLSWYREHAALLLGFFGPLELVTTLLVSIAAALGVALGAAGAAVMVAAAVLSLAVLATFPLYFRRANASFAEATLCERDVPGELTRWAGWHRARVVLATIAFAAAALASAGVA